MAACTTFCASSKTGALICHYDGSMVSFYYNRQAVGTYKGNTTFIVRPVRVLQL